MHDIQSKHLKGQLWPRVRRKKYICLPWVPLVHAWSWKQAGCRVVLLPEFFAGFGTTCEDFCALHYHPFPPFEALPSLPCLSQHPRPTWGVMEFAYFFFYLFTFIFYRASHLHQYFFLHLSPVTTVMIRQPFCEQTVVKCFCQLCSCSDESVHIVAIKDIVLPCPVHDCTVLK